MRPKSDEERVQGIRDWALRVDAPNIRREISWLCDEVTRLQKARRNLLDLTQEQARQITASRDPLYHCATGGEARDELKKHVCKGAKPLV